MHRGYQDRKGPGPAPTLPTPGGGRQTDMCKRSAEGARMQRDTRKEFLAPVGMGSCTDNLPEEPLRGPKKGAVFVGVAAPVKQSRQSSGQEPDPREP